MNELELMALVAGGESLTLEFKGEDHGRLNDRDLVLAAVCLANSEGGTILVGVEDDGRITGAHGRHPGGTNADKLVALVRNRTVSGLQVSVTVHHTEQGDVIELGVPKARSTTCTSEGTCQHRAYESHGWACVPYPASQHQGRGFVLGAEDLSAQPCVHAAWADLDPLQFERARNVLQAPAGDKGLLSLSDMELAGAIGAVESVGERIVPTFAGLLLLGREEALRRHIPTHEAAFQVLDPGGDVRMNDAFRKPLIELAELIEQRFKARNQEREVLVGMIRMAIPDYSFPAFREALLNALFHRDYHENNGVYVQWHPDHLFITSPGGFPEGVTAQNLLTHEPKPRNRRLYEAGRRLGLVEQTGRGVDKVYDGQVRYGRPVPDYSRSSNTGVRLVLQGGSENLSFAAFIFQRERAKSRKLTVGEMIGLNRLFHQRRLTPDQLAVDMHGTTSEAEGILARLVEDGLVEPRSEKQDSVYQFTSAVYKALGKPLAHARVKGLDDKAREKAVLDHVAEHGSVRREEAMVLTGLAARQTTGLLKALVRKGKLVPKGERRWRHYHLPGNQRSK
ncbi:MAG: ATP-binding protein [Flavobacteriales bacterium]